MSESLRSLLAGCIDYAGVFPPAQLPLNLAMRDYARYVQEPESWLLNRFVCPIAQLAALSASASTWQDVRRPQSDVDINQRIRRRVARQLGIERERIPESLSEYWHEIGADSLDTVELVMELEEEFDLNISSVVAERVQSIEELLVYIQNGVGHRVAVIGSTSESFKQFMEQFGQDMQQIADFQRSQEGLIRADSLELKLPSELFESETGQLQELLRALRHKVQFTELYPMNIFIELPAGREQEFCLNHLLAAAHAQNDDRLKLKIRTGGPTADVMPGPDQLAVFIESCVSADIAWKATAGLHEVLSRFESNNGIWHFGFLNVLAAAVLASVHRLQHQQIVIILTETEIGQFKFTECDFRWGEFAASVEQIDLARRHSMLSFGSCSFDEPRDGLRKLLLIP